jgi:hypothetical protein
MNWFPKKGLAITQVPYGVPARIIPRGLPSGNNYDSCLEPRHALRRVRCEAALRHDALQIHFAHTLKQRHTVLLNVIGVSRPRFRNLCHETSEFLFAVG